MDPLSRYGVSSCFGWGKYIDDGKVVLDFVTLDVLQMSLPISLSILAGLILRWSWRPQWPSLVAVGLRSGSALLLSLSLPKTKSFDECTNIGFMQVLEGSSSLAAQLLSWTRDPLSAMRRITGISMHKREVEHVQQPGMMSSHVLSNGGAQEPSLNSTDRTPVIVGLEERSSSSEDACTAVRSDQGSLALQVISRIQSSNCTLSRHSDVLPLVTDADFQDCCRRLEGTQESVPEWEMIMDKAASHVSYKSWRRDTKNGPTEYRSCTIFEDCSSELMRDFFWDDEFRPCWDELLARSETLESCPLTGYQAVVWVRKFPFLFCRDREYVFGRRTWSEGNTYYSIAKKIEHSAVPRKGRPKRVEAYYSCWRIRQLEGGQCEVLCFHAEDMGMPKDLAKIGIRQGMWMGVMKIDSGIRKYKLHRQKVKILSHSASFAGITTPLVFFPRVDLPRSLSSPAAVVLPTASSLDSAWPNMMSRLERAGGQDCRDDASLTLSEVEQDIDDKKKLRRSRWIFLLGGSVVAVLCGADKVLVTKIVLARFAQKKISKLAFDRS